MSLDAIEHLQVDEDVAVRVIVVDNDVAETARRVVESRAERGSAVEYVVEPRRGIAFARNRAIVAASDAELVAFVDDDEALEPGWLAAVLAEWRRTGADVVIGPSFPTFPAGTPSWVIDGGFFERQRFASGESVPARFARTSGVLIAQRALRGERIFDTRFPLTGGSDTELFQRLEASGGRIVWSDDAHVIERVPRTRTSVRWLVLRRYRIGNTRSLRNLPTGRAGVVPRAKRTARGLVEAASGVGTLVASVGKGRVAHVRALQEIAYGAGLVTGALGLVYNEYRFVHGE